MQSIIFLYGLAGAGKSFIGDLIGKEFGYFVYHADMDLTKDMKEAIQSKTSFTPEMRDEFFLVVAKRISELKKVHDKIVITQGAYKRQHREFLKSVIPELVFICISADEEIILERLQSRGDLISPEYAKALKLNFEPPLETELFFLNNESLVNKKSLKELIFNC